MAESPLHLAVSKSAEEFQSLLQAPGVDINALNGRGQTALHSAVIIRALPIIRLLLDAGASVDLVRGGDGISGPKTPLCEAVLDGQEEIIKLLLDAGANGDYLHNGSTVLALACSRKSKSSGNICIIQLLIQSGVDVNKMGESWGSLTPLHTAADNNLTEVAQMLIEAGAGINAALPTSNWRAGQTPLHLAASGGCAEATKVLINAGADVNLKSRRGETPLILAVSGGADDATVATLLVQAGADVLHKDDDGLTAMKHLEKRFSVQPEELNEKSWLSFYYTMAILVVGGDRDWDSMLPAPCPGLERALFAVWRHAPEELPLLFCRLENRVELRIQFTLRMLHRLLPEEDVRMRILAAAMEPSRDIENRVAFHRRLILSKITKFARSKLPTLVTGVNVLGTFAIVNEIFPFYLRWLSIACFFISRISQRRGWYQICRSIVEFFGIVLGLFL